MADEYTFEEQPGSGWWLAIEERHKPNRMIEVSERCWRQHRMLGGGSPNSPTRVEKEFDVFK